MVKPFLKWAGGKTRLLSQLESHLPINLGDREDWTYIEPFMGGGAMMLNMIQKYPRISRIICVDINQDLIEAYRLVKDNPEFVIEALTELSAQYLNLLPDERDAYYYDLREKYNVISDLDTRVIYFIFLNHTCFNGLYRENRQGLFNVPHGKYKKPTIINKENIRAISRLVHNVEFKCGQYDMVEEMADDDNVFIYLDPPYRASSKNGTVGSMFTKYNMKQFDDECQRKLNEFCERIDQRGWQFMLSNSDSYDDGVPFFDQLYERFNIYRIPVKRYINPYSKTTQRNINEIIITNY